MQLRTRIDRLRRLAHGQDHHGAWWSGWPDEHTQPPACIYLSYAINEYRRHFGLPEREIHTTPDAINAWLREGGMSPVPTGDITTFSNEAGTFHYATRTRHMGPLAFAGFFQTMTNDEHATYWAALSPEDRAAIERRIGEWTRR